MIATLSSIQEAYVAAGFGERDYHNTTTLYPVGLAVLAMCALAMFVVPRRYAIVPLIALESIVPTAQRIVVAGLDWNFGRILVVVGCLRILAKGEAWRIRLNRIDKAVLAWAILGILVYSARRGSVGALIYKLGLTVDTLGIYALARVWIRDRVDVDRISGAISVLALFAGAMFLYENATQTNLYSIVGGVNDYTSIREGRLRCQGPFKHPILAGVFWVSLFPWIAIRWWTRPSARILTVLGAAGALIAVYASSSSTPIMGFGAGLFGVGMYLFRYQMRWIRWGAFFTLVALHMVMNKPVWHLITRINVIAGSTGYHRYRLINAWVNHWPEWLVLGSKSTASWGWYLFDVTNQYIKESVDGGLVGLILFVMYFSFAYGSIGRMMRAARRRAEAYQLWGIGIAIFMQCVMFLSVGITHAQQNLMCWLLPISACAALWQTFSTEPSRRRALAPGSSPDEHRQAPAARGGARPRVRRLWPEGQRPVEGTLSIQPR